MSCAPAEPGPSLDRNPPQDIDAEKSVLGAMLSSKDAIADVVEEIKGVDFYRPGHELIFNTITDLYGRGDPADTVTTADELDRRGELERAGGRLYLAELLTNVTVTANATYYAKIVAEKAVLRRLVEASIRIAQMGYQGQGEVADIVDAAQQTLYDVSTRKTSEEYHPLSELFESTFDELEAIEARGDAMAGIPTGFTDLDELTNGFMPGQMVIVAARPAMGKSTLALDFARAAAIKNHLAAAIFSLEMGRNEIVMRLLSAEAGIELSRMRAGRLSEEDWQRMVDKTTQISSAPLFIDDSPNLTMMEIRAKARRMKQKFDLKLIIIDYMQLMTSGKKVESRQLEVSEFSRQIKLLAKELEIPVVALSQLNRGPEQRTDKKPMMSDLRESGSLEQDADVVILLHREDVYDKESPRAGEADIIVAKHRNGPTRTVPVVFQGHYSRFVDMQR